MNRIYLILFGVIVSLSAVFPQEKLSLNKAIQIALDNNIDVLRATNVLKTQQANVTAAFGTLLPTVSARASWSRTGSISDEKTSPGFPYTPTGNTLIDAYFSQLSAPSTTGGSSARNSVSAGIDASVVLFDGFRNTSTLSKSENQADASDYDLQKLRQSTVLIVQQAYLTVLRNKQLLKVNEDNLKRSREQLARIVESNKVGAVAKADLYRQQVTTARDELNVISAQSNYENSKYELLYILALDMNKEYDIDDATVIAEAERLDSTYLSNSQDYDALVKQALEFRPDYQSSKLSIDIASKNLSISASTYYPTLSLNGGFGIGGSTFSNMSDTKDWNIGLSLRLPLFSGFQTTTAVQISELDYNYAQQNLLQAERKVKKELSIALLNLETAKKKLDVSAKSVVSAEEDRRIAEERYNLGANTLLDLLVATANYTQALSDKVSASYDFLYAKEQFKIAIGKEKY